MKFVIFGKCLFNFAGSDIIHTIFADSIDQKKVVYLKKQIKSYFDYLNSFYEKKWRKKIRIHFCIPFRNIVFRKIVRSVDFNDDTCLIFFDTERWFFGEEGFLKYLNKKYRNCVTVYYLTNLVQYQDYDIELLKNEFDYVFTYALFDSKRYDLNYLKLPYSKNNSESSGAEQSDLFFCANAKNRLSAIHEIYKNATQNGLKCIFYVNAVSENNQKYPAEIHYNEFLPYNKVIDYVKNTKCILELLQDKNDWTLRESEAIVYDKKLLTNSTRKYHSKSNGQSYYYAFRDVREIDFGFITDDSINCDVKEKEDLSTDKFFEEMSMIIENDEK